MKELEVAIIIPSSPIFNKEKLKWDDS